MKEVDLLFAMFVTFPVSHLEISALNASALLNTTTRNGDNTIEMKKTFKKKSSKNNREIPSWNKWRTEVDVLNLMVVTLPVFHLETSALNALVF